ncbi:MAG TPA: RbsD/FucU domain-containing protein [Acidobacteriaceae bacterium]|nr:RbsD/FucU domain-containing protein [Acidobacteriaceae bacterium]
MNMLVRSFVLLAAPFLIAGVALAASRPEDGPWQSRVQQILPLLGHRNWILIVDSAYPLQTSPGVETLETNADQIEVIRSVLAELDHSIHVRPIVYTDAELPFVPEHDAPGVNAYRKALKGILAGRPIHSLPHEQLLKKVDETGREYQIVILKTRMTVPYTSVFLQLDCKYWSDAAEQQLRQAMKQSAPKQ